MSRPFARSRLVNLLLIASLATGAGCGGGGSDEASETKPGAFRIARAIVTKLLSNSIEISETGEVNETEPAAPTALLDTSGSSRPLDMPGPAAPQTCIIPYTGPVTIIAARTPTALARSIADRSQVRLVYETEDTAIWEDGRVVTLDVEELGTHLDAVGWVSNPMRILGAGTRPAGSAANVWNSGTSTFKRSAKSNTRKRRKRRRG